MSVKKSIATMRATDATSAPATELITALEKATGPDRELDLKIAIAVWGRPGVLVTLQDQDTGERHDHTYWEYTASIDAAMTLVPGDWNWELSNNPPYAWMCERGYDADTYNGDTASASAKTPAIALCIAALRALNSVANDRVLSS